VQVTAQLLPPYTPYLSDYTAPGAQKMMVQVRLNDPTVTSYQCKLRLTIEGVGLTLRTKASIFLSPIALQGGGIPQLFYGEDLEEYFRPDNLDFSGLSRVQYEKGASLPEGVYRFTVEILDYNRNIVVSNRATAVAWMVLNDPPMLNLPVRETKIRQLTPTNIPFTWTPRHTGSPNAAFTTEYIFRMVEMAPGTPSSLAQNAMQSQPTLYELTTTQTQIVYGMSEPALIPGRKYAWQVQAKDTDGRDLFKNDGRSEVYVFQFGDALAVPENMYLQSANSSALTIRWEQNTPAPLEQNFRVSYRPRQNRNTEQWYEIETKEQWKAITQLKPDTEYEVKVRSEQGALAGEYNPVQIYRTVPIGVNEFVCKSDVPPLPSPRTALPLFGLSINDTIRAGGYDVLVRHVTGSGGTFSGDGVVIVPWFNSSKVRVTFKNISVNSQFFLTAGVIESMWDADSKFLLEVPPNVSSKPGSIPNAGNIPINIAETDSLIRITGAAIAAVTKDDEGNVVISTTDGRQLVIENGKSFSIADDIGNGYVVDKEGNLVKTTANEAVATAERGDRKYNIALKFEKGNGTYGFDEQPKDASKDILASYYQAMEDGKRISWKAMADGKTDFVTAAVEGSALDPKKISFELNGTPVKATSTDKIEVNLMAQGDGVTSELIAKYEGSDEIVGKLNVINYAEITRNLVLVSVNEKKLAYASSLKSALNNIYRQAAVQWNVTIDETGIKVPLDTTFDDTSDELLSNYTDDMKKVINAYTKDHTLAPDTYYLFLVDKPRSGTKFGYLPRKKQAGFLFVDKLDTEIVTIKTVAHELGHGAFRLEHTFKQFPSLTKEMTNNLMDYKQDGTYLYKYQWDCIHNPEAMMGLFEDDEDAAYETDGHYSTIYLIGKMLGLPFYKKLAWFTEFPDNRIHDKHAIVRTTWSEREHQLLTHALTWDHHSIEEFKTAVAFMNANAKDYVELGRLLHRYGDCYAHTRLEDDIKPFLEKRMYGDTIQFLNSFGITAEHFIVDGSKPDMIGIRPKWYLEYVHNAAELIALKYNVNPSKIDFNLFKNLSNYASKYNVSLIGIIDYHVAKLENKKQFIVPRFIGNGSYLSNSAADTNDKYLERVKNIEDYLKRNKIKYKIKRNTFIYDDAIIVTNEPTIFTLE